MPIRTEVGEKQGYFSLVQYSEYPERAEFVNVGVVLFIGMEPHVLHKFVKRPSRVQKMFGSRLGVEFDHMIQSMAARLDHEFSKGWSAAAVRQFIDMRSGKLHLTTARSVLVGGSPHDLVDQLFGDLVDAPRRI